jgi:hypothetical protein
MKFVNMNMSTYPIFASLGISLALVVGCTTTSSQNSASNRQPAQDSSGGPSLNKRFEQSIENEPQVVQIVVGGILAIQNASATPDGRLHRGTHAKGTCVSGNLEIFDLDQAFSDRTMASRLKNGMFSRAGKYPTVIRFANADHKINDDTKPDVRAISLAVSTPVEISNPQGRMDFAMNNAPVFPIKDAQVFADVMLLAQSKIAVEEAKKTGDWRKIFSALHVPFDLRALPSVIRRVKNVGEAIITGEKQKRQTLTAYQKMTYWSNVPFQLGANEAVKYVLVPCDSNQAQPLSQDPNTLKKEILRHINNDNSMSCWDFQVQPLEPNMVDDFGKNHEATDWVENALVEWKTPAYTVGKLTLTPNSSLDQETCETRLIDVTKNSSDIHRGLGSINRARVAAETASAAKRGAH